MKILFPVLALLTALCAGCSFGVDGLGITDLMAGAGFMPQSFTIALIRLSSLTLALALPLLAVSTLLAAKDTAAGARGAIAGVAVLTALLHGLTALIVFVGGMRIALTYGEWGTAPMSLWAGLTSLILVASLIATGVAAFKKSPAAGTAAAVLAVLLMCAGCGDGLGDPIQESIRFGYFAPPVGPWAMNELLNDVLVSFAGLALGIAAYVVTRPEPLSSDGS